MFPPSILPASLSPFLHALPPSLPPSLPTSKVSFLGLLKALPAKAGTVLKCSAGSKASTSAWEGREGGKEEGHGEKWGEGGQAGREGGREGRRAYLGIDEDGVLVGGLVEEEMKAGLELLSFLWTHKREDEEKGRKE